MGADAAISSIREAFGRVTWTHKTHEKAIDRLSARMRSIKFANIILLVFTTAGLLSAILGGSEWVDRGAALFSACALALAVYQLSFDPTKAISAHRQVAKSLWHIRERYIHLLADIQDRELTVSEIRRSRDALASELAEIYAEAPDTTPADYRAATRALKIKEEMTFTDDEINRLLPPELRKVSGG